MNAALYSQEHAEPESPSALSEKSIDVGAHICAHHQAIAPAIEINTNSPDLMELWRKTSVQVSPAVSRPSVRPPYSPVLSLSMVHDASWPVEGLLAAWASSLLYGMNVIATASYVHISYRKGLKRTANRVLLAIALVQFILATIHVSVCLRSAIEGFIYASEPSIYFQDQGNPMHLAQTVAYATNSLIADAILAWRLYVVQGKRRWVWIPYVALICGTAVCSYTAVAQLANHHAISLLFAELEARWAIATWSLSISIQVSATSMIAWVLWSVHRESRKLHNDRTIVSVMWVILESGAVLSTATVILLAFYVNQMTAGGIVVAFIGQLATLVPTSILVRITLTTNAATRSSLTTTNAAPQGRNITIHFAAKTASDTTTDYEVEPSSRSSV